MDAATFVFTFSRSVVTAMTRTSTRKGSSVAHSAFLHGSQCRRRGGGSHRLIVHRSDSSKGSSNWSCYWWQRQKPIGSWVVSRHTQSWLSAKITADCHHHSSIQKPKHREKFCFFQLKRKKLLIQRKISKTDGPMRRRFCLAIHHIDWKLLRSSYGMIIIQHQVWIIYWIGWNWNDLFNWIQLFTRNGNRNGSTALISVWLWRRTWKKNC